MLIEIFSEIENHKLQKITYTDALIYLNYIQSSLKEVKEIEYDINFNNQIKETGSIIPRDYCSILSELVFYQFLMNKVDKTKEYPDNIGTQLTEVSTIAMKYQLLYYEIQLENILQELAKENAECPV